MGKNSPQKWRRHLKLYLKQTANFRVYKEVLLITKKRQLSRKKKTKVLNAHFTI